eukprot:gene2236-33719_t
MEREGLAVVVISAWEWFETTGRTLGAAPSEEPEKMIEAPVSVVVEFLKQKMDEAVDYLLDGEYLIDSEDLVNGEGEEEEREEGEEEKRQGEMGDKAAP